MKYQFCNTLWVAKSWPESHEKDFFSSKYQFCRKMEILQTPLGVAKTCPEGPVKNFFQNVNFWEKINLATSLGVAKTYPKGPIKYFFQNVNYGEKCQFCYIGVAKTCPEGPLKDLFQNVSFGEKFQFCNIPRSSQNLFKRPCEGFISKFKFWRKM